MGRITRWSAVILAIFVMATAACSSKAEASEVQSKEKCMTALTPEQKEEFKRNEPDAQISSQTTHDNGTSDICVLEQQPDGSYAERHYAQRDGFGDYLLYSALFGHSNTLATYGLITGDLSFGEYMALSLLTGVNSRGGLFHPYSCGLASCPYGQPYSWNRQPTVINNVHVTNIQYGNQPARPYNGGKRPKPPKGYAKPKPIPKAKDKVANVTKDASGKPTVTPVKGVSAKKVAAGKQQLPGSIKTVSPVTTIAKPKTQTTAKPAGTTPGTTKTTTKTQTTSKPKGGKPKSGKK